MITASTSSPEPEPESTATLMLSASLREALEYVMLFRGNSGGRINFRASMEDSQEPQLSELGEVSSTMLYLATKSPVCVASV